MEKMNRNSILSAKDLSVGYEQTVLLSEIAMDLKAGDILGIIGPNGAGKTTLLKSLIRQIKTLGGTVCVEGEELEKISGQALSQKMAVVLTERPKTEMMHVREVVATGRYPYTGRFGILSEEDEGAVTLAMEMTSVTELAETDFTKISDGQKQRVMLARAICQETDLIVLDEPTSYLDVKYKIEFMTILQKMAREKKTAILITLHELDLAQRLCSKVMCIGKKGLERYGSVEDIFSGTYIEELFEMQEGSFDNLYGSVELKRPEGAVKVYVAAGGGYASAIFRQLQREGIPFVTGVIPENDLDYPAARALASEVVTCGMYAMPSKADVQRAQALIQNCERVLVPKKIANSDRFPDYFRAFEYEIV